MCSKLADNLVFSSILLSGAQLHVFKGGSAKKKKKRQTYPLVNHFFVLLLQAGITLANSPAAPHQPPQSGWLAAPSVPSSPGPWSLGWRSVPSPASCACEAGTSCCSSLPFSAVWWDNCAGGSAGQSWTFHGSNPYHCFLCMRAEGRFSFVNTYSSLIAFSKAMFVK